MKNNKSKRKYSITNAAPTFTIPLSPDEIAHLQKLAQVGKSTEGRKRESEKVRALALEEEWVLLRALARTSPGGTFTQAEAERVFQWADQVRMDATFLSLALSGCLSIGIRQDGELVFDAVEPSEILATQQNGEEPPAPEHE